MSAAPSFETVSDLDAFCALGDEWDALVRAMPRPSPFLLHGWLVEWWRHHGDGAELQVHVARRGGRLVGGLPLCVRPRLGVRVARFVGGGATALADLLLADGEDGPCAAGLTSHAGTAGNDLVDLFGLPTGSRLAAAAGPRLALVERVEAPVLELGDEGWEATYRRKTAAKKRNLHRRRRRQLAELGAVRTRVARSADELAPALEEAFRLHELRWRDRPEASGFATPAGRRFHRAALRALAETGAPRIVLLELDGSAIACNYFFLLGERMYFHELAFDPAYARWSPGLVTTLDAVAAAAQEGARVIEFLGGAERYKLELADRFEPLYQAVGLAAGARGRALAHAQVAAIRSRRRLKRTPVRRLYYERLGPVHRAVARRRR